MLTYNCSNCGEMVEQEVEWLDSGTQLFCPKCNGPTVVDLDAPAVRVARFHRERALEMLVAAGVVSEEKVAEAVKLSERTPARLSHTTER
jgi:DNA-directed RNA polymerase subunit RPC12/RpoP